MFTKLKKVERAVRPRKGADPAPSLFTQQLRRVQNDKRGGEDRGKEGDGQPSFVGLLKKVDPETLKKKRTTDQEVPFSPNSLRKVVVKGKIGADDRKQLQAEALDIMASMRRQRPR